MSFPGPQGFSVNAEGVGNVSLIPTIFSNVDPTPNNNNQYIQQNWVNNITQAIWVLQKFYNTQAQWRAIAPIIVGTRNPTSSDYQYPLGQSWLYPVSNNVWFLASVSGTTANWVLVSSGGGDVLSITATAPIVASSSTGNVNLSLQTPLLGQYGGTGVANTGLTINLGSATSGYVLTSDAFGNATWQPASGGSAVTSLHTQDGNNVTPTSGIINLSGSGSLATTGTSGPNTATISLTGLTNHNVLVGAGTSTITKVSPSTSGFVLTSNGLAADPSFQALPSTSITFAGDTGTPFATTSVTIRSNNSGNACGSSILFNAATPNITLQVTDSNNNTFIGKSSGNLTLTGQANIGIGFSALSSITNGLNNVAEGFQAVQAGNPSYTISIGSNSGKFTNAQFATIVGTNALGSTGSGDYCLILGYASGGNYVNSGESSNILLMNAGVLGESNVMRLGTQGPGNGQVNTTYIAGIAGATVTAGSPTFGAVIIDTSDGQVLSATTGISTSGFVLTSNGTATAPTWKSVSAAGAITTITGNSGGAESPSAGNFNIVGTGSITVAGSANTETVQLTGLTNHAVLVGAGTATITKVGPTATTGQVLQNNSGADPSYSTATYPSTTTINQILYSSSANVVAGLSTTNSAVLVTTSGGVPGFSSTMTNGQVIIGSTGATPTAATLTAGTGISITNGAGSITIAATGTTTLNVTSVNNASSPYTVLSTDDFLACQTSTGTITIKLPNAPTTGRVYVIKDSNGNALTNNISVTTVGGTVTIDGVTTYTMSVNYQSISVIFDGTNYEVF